ncbi:MAG: winged helix-turn-helix domain-containing protein [Nitrososphaerota archaeon]
MSGLKLTVPAKVWKYLYAVARGGVLLSHEGVRRLFYWLLVGSRGGPTRLLIILKLRDGPANANQLAASLKLNYKTIQHHLQILLDNRMVVASGEKYNVTYSISPELAQNMDILESIVVEVARLRGRWVEGWAWGLSG